MDTTNAVWRKSSRSGGGNGDNCVEITQLAEVVAVRDSKNPTGPTLAWSGPTWRSFVDQLR
ncbi:MAG TPA: DUF397 domain-containing protein [Pseudonocardiaceae bacterium]|nr:DUF397 domain-containing protein [Pseudonocardiaceae bacterium]